MTPSSALTTLRSPSSCEAYFHPTRLLRGFRFRLHDRMHCRLTGSGCELRQTTDIQNRRSTEGFCGFTFRRTQRVVDGLELEMRPQVFGDGLKGLRGQRSPA